MTQGRGSGAIYDIGYRPYTGERRGEGAVVGALYWSGLRNAFGFGRSGRSKILPLGLLAINLLPAIIVVGVVVIVDFIGLPISYASYAMTTQLLTSVFVAAQGPVLFSRDLRFGSIALYLARPVRSDYYVLARWAALATAAFAFLLLPVLVLYVGALLAGLDASTATHDTSITLIFLVILAAMLASVSGLISAASTRRGFAVVGTIAVLTFGYGVVATIQGIAYDQGQMRVGQIAGLANPFSIYAGEAQWAIDGVNAAITPPTGGMVAIYLIVSVLGALLGPALLARRYRKLASR